MFNLERNEGMTSQEKERPSDRHSSWLVESIKSSGVGVVGALAEWLKIDEIDEDLIREYIEILHDEEYGSDERIRWLRDKAANRFPLSKLWLQTASSIWEKVYCPKLVTHAFDPNFIAFTRLMDDLAVLQPDPESIIEKGEELLVSNED